MNNGNGSDIITFGNLQARVPKSISWQPKPDITAHELAVAIIPLLMGFSHPGVHVEDTIANLPEGARRHFVIT